MNTQTVKIENAVAAIRISSLKQGLQGDSPEAQKEQIERFALSHNIHIKKFFIFMESASKEEQPVQEAIDYCKSPKNDIQLFIIKSIDRFTRGGSYLYDHLKMQLTQYGVKLVDIYGIIGSQDVNTLEHLDISYNWSVYSPTKKAEILEAERAKDEMRDIMTRMIGAEIRYVRLGFRVRQPPYGYVNEKVESAHGKRVILKAHPEESQWIVKMFELRAVGVLNDHQIIEKINALGFHTRKQFMRDPNDRTKVIGEKGSKKLVLHQFWRFIQNPIYAGVNIEKWTQGEAVKGKFDGLISLELFNKANKGKRVLTEGGGEVKFWKDTPPKWTQIKRIKNPNFPYKRHVLCPHCNKPFFGSASRGSCGKYYPAYHCNKRGHYFRIPSTEMEDTVKAFVHKVKLTVTPEYIEKLKKYVLDAWETRQENTQKDTNTVDTKISELKMSVKATVEKIKFVSSPTAIKYLEDDLITTENQIKELEIQKVESTKKEVNMDVVMANVEYFLEHLEYLLIGSPNPLKRAEYFGLMFQQTPTYSELVSGTPKLAPYLGLKGKFNYPSVPKCESAGIRTQNQ